MRKQSDPIQLRTVLLDTGERLPVLCAADSGEPLYDPLLYSLTEMRAANNAFNTLRHGVLVIAELLDHSDTQHAGVYVATRPEIVQRIDKAVALELAPLAQAFKGTLIPSESAATRATDTSSRIRDLRVSAEPLASCGQHSYCSPNSPLACYTCSSFEPWLDGPHEQLLEVLLAKRDRQLVDTGRRIATIHDRAIHAVAQVVRLCKLRKGEAL